MSAGGRAHGTVPEVRAERWWDRLVKPFWVLPAACVLAAIALGIALPHLEEEVLDQDLAFVFQGGPDGAREVLGTVSSSMISVTGLVFSITMVVLQLASSQFSPRVLNGFLQSRLVQGTLGIFLGTFVFALTVTRYVRGGNETTQFVPQISVTLAFLLVLACVGFFLAFIHHITTTIQVSNVISRIGHGTVELALRMYPVRADEATAAFAPTWSPGTDTPRVATLAPRHGVLTHVNYAGLVRWAVDRDVVVTLDRSVGQFLVEGQHLLRVWGVEHLSEDERRRVYREIGLASQREMRQDVAFGIRQLVDIAARALSPGINDPTTAVQCLDELHRILRSLVQQASPSPYIVDDLGQVRVVHQPQAVSDLIDLAVMEIAHFGKDTLQVPARLRRMLEDLLAVTAERYRSELVALLESLPDPAGEHGSQLGVESTLR